MGFPVFDILASRAELGPDRLAMQDVVTGDTVTYRELNRRTGRSTTLLASLGVEEGERVALLCRNRIEFFELLFACARLSAILVPLNWRMPAHELKPLMADCGAGWLIHGKEDAAVANRLDTGGLEMLALDDSGESGFSSRRDASEANEGQGNLAGG